MDKAYYRTYAKDYRKTLDINQVSGRALDAIRAHKVYKAANNIMLFYPTKYEIDLLPLLEDSKNFFLPKVEVENLLVCPYSKDLVLSTLKIYEPNTKPVSSDILDLVIVPALMGDKRGYRLGYGGGYYDRFLKHCKAEKLTVLPKELVVDELPADIFDEKVEIIEV